MAPSKVLSAQYVDDETWRKELCPECGARLLGLAAWKDHAPRHGWGEERFAARVRAGRPGEVIQLNPAILGGGSNSLRVEAVEDATWKLGIPA